MILYLQQSTDTNHSNSVPSFFMWCLLSCTSSRWVYYYIIITRYPRILVDCCVGYSIHHRASTRNFCVASRTLSMMIWWFLLLYLLRLCHMLLIVSAWVRFYYFLSRHHADWLLHPLLLLLCRYVHITLDVVPLSIDRTAALIDFLGEGQFMPIWSDPIGYAHAAMANIRRHDFIACDASRHTSLQLRLTAAAQDTISLFGIRFDVDVWDTIRILMSDVSDTLWYMISMSLFDLIIFTDIRFHCRFLLTRSILIDCCVGNEYSIAYTCSLFSRYQLLITPHYIGDSHFWQLRSSQLWCDIILGVLIDISLQLLSMSASPVV